MTRHSLLAALLLSLGFAAGCGGSRSPVSAPAPAPAPLPDWIELEGPAGTVRAEGEVFTDPDELARPIFAPLQGTGRLLVYAYPQVQRLTLPKDGLARDVAFFDIGGRVIDLYPGASCPGPAACPPLPSRFAAASVLIAKPGTFARLQLARHKQMRWGQPRRQQTRPVSTPVPLP